MLFILFVLFCSSSAERDDGSDPFAHDAAIKVTNRIFRAFDQRNYTGWEDFDPTFFYDICGPQRYAQDFLREAKEYRNTFKTGDEIKFAVIRATEVKDKFIGLRFEMHFQFKGQHHDMLVTLQRQQGNSFRWSYLYKHNCNREDAHIKPIEDDFLRTRVFS